MIYNSKISDGDELEDITLGPKPAFFVDSSIQNDSIIIPSDGFEYLCSVRNETALYPDILKSSTLPASIASDSDTQPPSSQGNGRANYMHKMNVHTQQQQFAFGEQFQSAHFVSDFSDVRQYYCRWRARLLHGHAPAEISHVHASLPDVANRSAWQQIFLGTGALSPLITLLISMTQVTVRTLIRQLAEDVWPSLAHARNTAEEQQRSRSVGTACVWTYALLAVLEKPLLPDTCSDLRQVSRDCGRVRAHLCQHMAAPDDDDVIALCLIIGLVGRYFSQFDIADPCSPGAEFCF